MTVGTHIIMTKIKSIISMEIMYVGITSGHRENPQNIFGHQFHRIFCLYSCALTIIIVSCLTILCNIITFRGCNSNAGSLPSFCPSCSFSAEQYYTLGCSSHICNRKKILWFLHTHQKHDRVFYNSSSLSGPITVDS